MRESTLRIDGQDRCFYLEDPASAAADGDYLAEKDPISREQRAKPSMRRNGLTGPSNQKAPRTTDARIDHRETILPGWTSRGQGVGIRYWGNGYSPISRFDGKGLPLPRGCCGILFYSRMYSVWKLTGSLDERNFCLEAIRRWHHVVGDSHRFFPLPIRCQLGFNSGRTANTLNMSLQDYWGMNEQHQRQMARSSK